MFLVSVGNMPYDNRIYNNYFILKVVLIKRRVNSDVRNFSVLNKKYLKRFNNLKPIIK